MIGDIIKKERLNKNITQGQLAKMIGVSPSTVGMYEQNRRQPDNETIVKLSNYFNVSVDYLLGRTAFRTHMELFEHWGGHNNPYFESPFDFGELLKKEREAQGISQEEASKALNITISDVEDIENGILPLNYDWAEKYANFLGTSVTQIFIDNGMSDSPTDIPLELLHHYQEQGLSEAEMIDSFTKFGKAEKNGVLSDYAHISEEDILTMAAHKAGHEGDLSNEELEKIKLAIQIALVKKK